MQRRLPEFEFARRARDHWSADGVPLLVGATIYLTIVGVGIGFGYLVEHLPSLRLNWFFDGIVGPLFVLFFITSPFWLLAAAIWLAIYWENIVEWCKSRLTYPRTGYVAPPSYWEDCEKEHSLRTKTKLERTLRTAGGFWFWLVLMSLLGELSIHLSRTRALILLAILVAVRAACAAFYPEAPKSENFDGWSRIKAFVSTTLNSFWVAVFAINLLPPFNLSQHPSWMPFILLGAGLVISVSAFYRRGVDEGTCILICSGVFALFAFKAPSANVAIAWLAPGVCAALVGTTRLFKTIRQSRAPSI